MDKNYFVLTTNSSWLVSIKHGCSTPRATTAFGSAANRCHQATYDNEAVVRRMIAEQADMRVSSELIPRCPKCGKPQTPNLRCDDSFVQDEGWYTAAQRYEDFLHRHRNGHILFLELGVGGNTPGIIKVPFLRMAAQNPKATYACINLGEAITTKELETQSILLDADIGAVLSDLK